MCGCFDLFLFAISLFMYPDFPGSFHTSTLQQGTRNERRVHAGVSLSSASDFLEVESSPIAVFAIMIFCPFMVFRRRKLKFILSLKKKKKSVLKNLSCDFFWFE